MEKMYVLVANALYTYRRGAYQPSPVCCPSVGGGRRIRNRSPSTRIGEVSIFSILAAGCSTSCKMSELNTCPSENTPRAY